MPETKKVRNVAPKSAAEHGRYDRDGRVLARKPDRNYLNALLALGVVESEPQRRLDRMMAELIDDKHDLGLPEVGLESEEVRLGSGKELVDRVRQWWPKAPVVRVPAMGVGDDPEDFSNDLEKGLNALISALSKAKRGKRGSLFSAVKTDVVAYGRGYAVLLPNPREYAGYPIPDPDDMGDPVRARAYRKKADEYSKGRLPPLMLRHLPAQRVIPFFDDDGLCEVFWITTERLHAVVDRAKARGIDLVQTKLHGLEKGTNTQVHVIHYANRQWCAEMVGTPNSYPPTESNPSWQEDCELMGPPYEHWLDNRCPVAYFPGMTTPLDEEHLQSVSVLYGARNVILMLDRLSSMKATVVRTWAWPTPVLKTSLMNAGLIEAGEDGRPRPVEIAPGLMMTLWPDEDISFLTYEGNGPDQDEMINLIQRQFDRIGLPAVESGQGDLSGYAAAQMRSAAQGKYSAIKEGMEQGWEDLSWIALEYLKQMPSTVYVPTVAELGWSGYGRYASPRTSKRMAYLALDPKKIRERNFVLSAEVEMDRSMDMVANAQTALALLQAGVSKRRVFETILGITDTSEERYQKLLEDFQESEGYRSAAFGDALRMGQIVIEPQQQAGGMGMGLTINELSQMPPAQVQGLVQAGLVDQATAQQYMQMQMGNISQGQVGGAGAMGAAPPGMSMAPPMAGAGGSPNATAMMGGASAMGMTPPGGRFGAMGGGSSPRAMRPAMPRPKNILSRGRAGGQSKQPPYR